MKKLLRNFILSKYSLILLLVLVGIFSMYILGDDNLVEEESEEIIQELTGVKIDLSPKSKILDRQENNGGFK